MNDQQRAAMQMAYETLERLSCVKQTMHLLWWQIEARKPLSVLREALAQPIVKESLTAQKQGEWIDLTDDEIKAAYEIWWEENGNHAFPIWVGAKSVIAAFKAKNAPAQRERQEPDCSSSGDSEPVAWALMHKNGLEFNTGYGMVKTLQEAEDMQRRHLGDVKIVPLYTPPPAIEAAIEATKEKAAKACESKVNNADDWDSSIGTPLVILAPQP